MHSSTTKSELMTAECSTVDASMPTTACISSLAHDTVSPLSADIDSNSSVVMHLSSDTFSGSNVLVDNQSITTNRCDSFDSTPGKSAAFTSLSPVDLTNTMDFIPEALTDLSTSNNLIATISTLKILPASQSVIDSTLKSEKGDDSNSDIDAIPVLVTDKEIISPIDLTTTPATVTAVTLANVSAPNKLVTSISAKIILDYYQSPIDSLLASENANASKSDIDSIPLSVTDKDSTTPIDLNTTPITFTPVSLTNANTSNKPVNATKIIASDSQSPIDYSLTSENSNASKCDIDCIPLTVTDKDFIFPINLNKTSIAVIPVTLANVSTSNKLVTTISTKMIPGDSQSSIDSGITSENANASKSETDRIPLLVSDKNSISPVNLNKPLITVTLANVNASNKLATSISTKMILGDSQSSIDSGITSEKGNASKSSIHRIPILVDDRGSISPIDLATTSVTVVPAILENVNALTTQVDSTFTSPTASTSKYSINLGKTSPITDSEAVAVSSASNSFASSSPLASANDSILPEVRRSRDSVSPASNLMRLKRPISGSFNSTSPSKQQKSIESADSEAMTITKSINENNSVSIIRSDNFPFSRWFTDSIESVCHFKVEDIKHETNWDAASTSVLNNLANMSTIKNLQLTSVVPKHEIEDTALSPSLNEITDNSTNFECKRENESPSGIETPNSQATSNPSSNHESQTGNPVTEALNTVQACAFMTMRNVPRRSRFSEFVFNRGYDENNYLFANEANTLLRSLPENIAIECKGFMLQFLSEVLEFSAMNGLLTD